MPSIVDIHDRSYVEGRPSKTSLCSCGSKNKRRYTFLESLDEQVPDHLRLPNARRIVHLFPDRRDEAARQLYRYFNKLSLTRSCRRYVDLTWNNRLLRTAGWCVLHLNGGKRTVTIELSNKVCDTAERVRDTLVHEMCHAAVWVINGEKQGHGPLWKLWADWANQRLPELPPISRLHSYSVATKYIYVCTNCNISVGRHSRSLDMSSCRQCGSRYALCRQSKSGIFRREPSAYSVRNSRAINRFSIFVKTHYSVVKMRERGIGHAQVMKILSMEYAKAKQSALESEKEKTRLITPKINNRCCSETGIGCEL
ncbi:HMG box-containing protein C19G7.04-like [Pomacea canaliculata]|uniref:HMG box-containing protein C19G7.04-like n=1 Tax=Pomacea canaliculata TaxID=400727 RepID=UPI000D7345FA|nr:HMG box-containing protein C19G7.04-like [Pomacea canaliculata]